MESRLKENIKFDCIVSSLLTRHDNISIGERFYMAGHRGLDISDDIGVVSGCVPRNDNIGLTRIRSNFYIIKTDHQGNLTYNYIGDSSQQYDFASLPKWLIAPNGSSSYKIFGSNFSNGLSFLDATYTVKVVEKLPHFRQFKNFTQVVNFSTNNMYFQFLLKKNIKNWIRTDMDFNYKKIIINVNSEGRINSNYVPIMIFAHGNKQMAPVISFIRDVIKTMGELRGSISFEINGHSKIIKEIIK